MYTMGSVFLIGFLAFLLTIINLPIIAAIQIVLIPPQILAITCTYAVPIIGAHVITLLYITIKYRKKWTIYLLALTPSIYLILTAPYILALWLIS